MTHPLTLAPTAGGSNIAGAWSGFYAKISGPAGPLLTLLTYVGAAMIVVAIAKYFWDKRRGGGGNHHGLLWTLIVGALFVTPQVLLPALLKLADLVINTIQAFLPN